MSFRLPRGFLKWWPNHWSVKLTIETRNISTYLRKYIINIDAYFKRILIEIRDHQQYFVKHVYIFVIILRLNNYSGVFAKA